MLKWVNTGAFAAMLAVNALANLLPIGGSTTGQISEAYPNLFTPAPFTFAIWGLIYLMMALFIVYQWGILDGGKYSGRIREKIGPWFSVSCALNIAWILLWHNRQIELSVICIALLLVTLIRILRIIGDPDGNLLQRVSLRTGFSVYYGWIIAATIANICVLLTKLGWNGWGLSEDFWTVAVLLTGASIAAAVVLIGKNTVAGFTVIWAYFGIVFRHISEAYYNGSHPFVIAAGFLSEALILAAILASQIMQIVKNLKYTPRPECNKYK